MINTPDFDNFRRCVDDAPYGTYDQAKELLTAIIEATDVFRAELRRLGLKVNNCDLAYVLEAALYDYAKRSNPDDPMFPTAEGFGDAMATVARDRVIGQAVANRGVLRFLGVAP